MRIQLADRIPCPKCHGGKHSRVNCEGCGGELTVNGELDLDELVNMVFAKLADGYTEKRRGLKQIEDGLDARCANQEQTIRMLREEIRCLRFMLKVEKTLVGSSE